MISSHLCINMVKRKLKGILIVYVSWDFSDMATLTQRIDSLGLSDSFVCPSSPVVNYEDDDGFDA